MNLQCTRVNHRFEDLKPFDSDATIDEDAPGLGISTLQLTISGCNRDQHPRVHRRLAIYLGTVRTIGQYLVSLLVGPLVFELFE
jgi:hypothetical protein